MFRSIVLTAENLLAEHAVRRDERKMRSANERAGPGKYAGCSPNRFNRRLSSTFLRVRDRSRYRNDISRPAFAAADGEEYEDRGETRRQPWYASTTPNAYVTTQNDNAIVTHTRDSRDT
ncbi:hypothetical protein DBV15_07387 [Temnothorax longispinosus]|uniref:Uncharacterized protein n=1 Tax=Temnothorax longispinosus TaxID=300112 RepID=A0A4V3SC39_9HYME|nr:hypothetical protein DBV15_07387 [Temnothorax longispinosus]